MALCSGVNGGIPPTLSAWNLRIGNKGLCRCHMGFLGGSDGKESASNAGDLGLFPGLGRCPGEGNDVIKVKNERSGHLRLGWALNPKCP